MVEAVVLLVGAVVLTLAFANGVVVAMISLRYLMMNASVDASHAC